MNKNLQGATAAKGKLLLLATLLLSSSLWAQSAQTGEMDWDKYVLTSVIVFGLIVFVILWLVLITAAKPPREILGAKRISLVKRLLLRLNNAAPIEQEGDIMMDDDYDGIRELDNKIPPWFNILFYGSMVFALVYLLNYHIFSDGQVMQNEYSAEMQEASFQKEVLFRSGKLVTETTVTQLKDAGSVEEGRGIFASKCAVCHGSKGEGLVGPNLTDDYWLNGGGIRNVFKTIKYGVPAKGMISWENQLSAKQIQEAASFVLSLHGTNPPNGKPPQGNKYEAAADDSAKIN